MNTTPKYSRLDPGQRREQILDAANALFAERGYDEVSVEDIASSAGVTTGAGAPLLRRPQRGLHRAARAARRPCARNNCRRPWAAAPAPAWPTACRAGSTGPRPTARSGWPRSGAAKTSPTPTSGHVVADLVRRAVALVAAHHADIAAGHATAALRARMLDRAQPRRHPTLATRRSHPRADPRTDRLHARTRPTHLRRTTQAKPVGWLALTPTAARPSVAKRLTSSTRSGGNSYSLRRSRWADIHRTP